MSLFLQIKRAPLLSVLLLLGPAAVAQSAADSAAVRAAALDYLEGWYAADAERMGRSLHPDLAKRIVRVDSAGAYRIDDMSAEALLKITGQGGGSRTPADLQRKGIEILDIEGRNASIKTCANSFFDYIHLARFDDRWMIVNVLWDMLPREDSIPRDDPACH